MFCSLQEHREGGGGDGSEGKGKEGRVCALLDGRRAMNDDAGQQGSRESEREIEKCDFPIWSASALEGRNSFGSRQFTQVAIPDVPVRSTHWSMVAVGGHSGQCAPK